MFVTCRFDSTTHSLQLSESCSSSLPAIAYLYVCHKTTLSIPKIIISFSLCNRLLYQVSKFNQEGERERPGEECWLSLELQPPSSWFWEQLLESLVSLRHLLVSG
jgi:hypothetical protein|uniref:Uncharacterized protein n=1 Tax=Arabidopsis thaliana TaxID=3702 RepID=Q0WLX5_ARATH|nr:hypothetical protein [Arabidopsis thaliana]